MLTREDDAQRYTTTAHDGRTRARRAHTRRATTRASVLLDAQEATSHHDIVQPRTTGVRVVE